MAERKVIGCICCIICGSRFSLKYKGTRACSAECSYKLHRVRKFFENNKYVGACAICGKRFTMCKERSSDCSKVCRDRLYKLENKKKALIQTRLRVREYSKTEWGKEVNRKWEHANRSKRRARETERVAKIKKINIQKELHLAIALHT